MQLTGPVQIVLRGVCAPARIGEALPLRTGPCYNPTSNFVAEIDNVTIIRFGARPLITSLARLLADFVAAMVHVSSRRFTRRSRKARANGTRAVVRMLGFGRKLADPILTRLADREEIKRR
jgi:hypothetical protein